jgi:hypothetical protein
MQRFKEGEDKRKTSKNGSLMDKYSAMMKASEILKQNGIDPKDVLTAEQKDDLADAEYIKKNS